jgi:DNA-binding NarL/FixJ family response regulator
MAAEVKERDAPDTAQEKPHLTDREQDVLQGVFEGLANKEIGARLEISESAVKATLQQLFRKTHVRTRGQLVRVALEGSFATTRKS